MSSSEWDPGWVLGGLILVVFQVHFLLKYPWKQRGREQFPRIEKRFSDIIMVRKKRTEAPTTGEGSESQEASSSAGRGAQHTAGSASSAQGGGYQGGRAARGPITPHPQYGGRGGSAMTPQPQYGGRGGGLMAPQPQYGGRGGRGGYQERGGMVYQQSGGPLPEYQARGYQQREGMTSQQSGSGMLESGGRRRGSGSGGVPGGRGSGGPSFRPSEPELHQASQASFPGAYPTQQTPSEKESPTEASSSSRGPHLPETSVVAQQLQQLSFQSEGTSSQAIQPVASAAASSKSMRFPLRPGKGNTGVRCMVKANHFIAELPDRDLHQYDVSITPEVTSRGVNRAVMGQLVRLYRDSHLGKRLPAYDGRKSLYTAGPLPFTLREFAITLIDEDDGQGGARRERPFRVVIKLAARADLHHLGLFLDGRQADAPQEALQVLDIVLRELPTARYSPVGRSFYSPDLGRRQPLGEGLESWRGFYQSIRPTQMGLSLNIDMSSTAFIEPLPVIDFVTQLLNRDVLSRPLSDADRVKIKKALRGVKVEVTHRGNMRRKYRISGLTSQATRELTFPVDEQGTIKTVVQYFQETYGFVIQHTTWPCLQVGNQQRPNYLPMEVCKIVEGQRYSKRLNERQITNLLRVTCQRPQDREMDIIQTVHHNAYDQDPYAKEFGIKISEKLASVEARILPAPWLKYHDTGREKDCLPQVGQWNMMNKKMVNGGTVNNWICINFARNVQENIAAGFCHELALMCRTSGMAFNLESVLPPYHSRPDQVERALHIRYREAMGMLKPQGKELDLLIVILPDNNGSLYGDLKRICETELGLVSQCCLTKHVFKMNKQYLANVSLKINVKVGGRNTVLVDALSRRIPLVSDRPTIIFGADVTHPHPGEDSSPSIAAVVASQDWPEVTKYAGLVCAQAHRQELIDDLYKEWKDPARGTVTGGMIKDGVSEGQFYQVLLHELDAIRKACASLEPNYQPPVTFVVVQKRHHTRLFAHNHSDKRTVDRSGNILPGTVVDTKICHPTEYARCTRSVSIVPPAYYAHLAAFRARFYMEPETSDSGSLTSGAAGRGVPVGGSGGARSTRVSTSATVRPLPALKDNVKKVMFYC
ncbi:hypothetical protein MRB53_022667 [Persea americana]|uniref:Uncharacterized protein n=1 Tax=Persea americana TaxID=3435 RepID=A0ACC2L7D0_PERAE|nr:hypothetical protein MRB53_022667 [Persea americana]